MGVMSEEAPVSSNVYLLHGLLCNNFKTVPSSRWCNNLFIGSDVGVTQSRRAVQHPSEGPRGHSEREGWNGAGGGGGRRDQYRAALEGEVRPSPVGHSVNLTTLKPNDDGIHRRMIILCLICFPCDTLSSKNELTKYCRFSLP